MSGPECRIVELRQFYVSAAPRRPRWVVECACKWRRVTFTKAKAEQAHFAHRNAMLFPMDEPGPVRKALQALVPLNPTLEDDKGPE